MKDAYFFFGKVCWCDFQKKILLENISGIEIIQEASLSTDT